MSPPAAAERTEIIVSGMTCASCAAHVGRALRKVPGVHDAEVNLAAEAASVEHAAGLNPQTLLKAIEGAGYGAQVVREDAPDDDARLREHELRRKRDLLILAIVLFIPLMVLGMAPISFRAEAWVMFALAMPVWAVVGTEFHRGAIAGLRHGTANMDTLVSLGSTAAFAYSLYAAARGLPTFFETSSAIITLVFIGKYLETAARARSNRSLRALLRLRPAIARVREASGAVREFPLDRLRPGMHLVVAAGERIPIDGVVEEGASAIDASMLTGEPLPVSVAQGDAVAQGTLNGEGTIIVRATAVGTGTTLAKIVELVRHAQASTPPVQRIADRVAGVFVPAILIAAAITFGAWMLLHHPWPQALAAAIAVLVVACPCALGLATPAAIMAAVGSGARRGLLFRDAMALEALARVRTVVFDKTGTLTMGVPQVRSVAAAPDQTEDELLRLTASLEQSSTHPLAGAIVRAAQARNLALAPASHVRAVPGAGLHGIVEGVELLAGTAALLREHGIEVSAGDADQASVYVSAQGRFAGAIHAADPMREESAQAVAGLQREGLRVALISGDAPEPTQALARSLRIEAWHARVAPAGKAEIVRELQREGAVAFVGDGINDAPALATADVGLAMGGGTEAALASAHVAMLSNDPRAVAEGIALSRATVRTIRQNLFWAFAYNAVLVPLAAAGIVHPILAAAAMGASSLFVVGNSLLLQRRHRREYA